MDNELSVANGSNANQEDGINNSSDWYYRGIMDFLNMMSLDPPPSFKKENQVQAQIEALERVRKDKSESLN